jgi:PIN domain nuclease of toxin-antitoxin system
LRVLLDTHALIWWDADPKSLSATARSIIDDLANEVLVSVVSVWEMAIKSQSGRLTLRVPLVEVVRQSTASLMTLLPVQLAHVLAVETLPPIHRDPFDRLLIAQAMVEGATLLTTDSTIQHYPISTIW